MKSDKHNKIEFKNNKITFRLEDKEVIRKISILRGKNINISKLICKLILDYNPE